jgi:hypothetical protein
MYYFIVLSCSFILKKNQRKIMHSCYKNYIIFNALQSLNYNVWVAYSYSKIILSEHYIYLIQCSDWLFLSISTKIILKNHPIRTLYIFDTVFWLAVFDYEYKNHTKKSSNQNTIYIWYSVLIGCFLLWVQKSY